MIPALKKKYDPQWPDMPREGVYQARSKHKEWLNKVCLSQEEFDRRLEKWDREHGV